MEKKFSASLKMSIDIKELLSVFVICGIFSTCCGDCITPVCNSFANIFLFAVSKSSDHNLFNGSIIYPNNDAFVLV